MMLMRFSVFAVVAAALVALAGCSSMGNGGGANGNAMQNQTQEQEKLATDATTVLQKQMARPPQKRIPHELVADAKCIAVFPEVTEGGLVIGGYHGEGIVTCRQGAGGFSSAAPAIYSLSGASVGLQAGYQTNTLILLYMTQPAVNSLFQSGVKLGTQIGITAGPVGFDRSIQGPSAPIEAYISNKSGLFGGINLNGTKMSFDDDMNAPLYRPGATAQGILLGNMKAPPSMTMYIDALRQYTTGGGVPNRGAPSQQGMGHGSGMQRQRSGGMQQGSGQGSGMNQGSGMQLGSGQGSGMQQQGSSM